MTVKFYTYTGPANTISKTLDTATDKTGNSVPGYQDLTAPVIQITHSTVPTFNYAYISDYGKYYFLSPARWISGNVFEYSCTEDTLMTYATAIKAQSGLCRYSMLGSMGLPDPRISFEAKKRVSTSTVTISADYRTGWYVIRYYNVYIPGGGLAVPKTFCAAFMNETSWQAFLTAYEALTDENKVIVGNCIIDVSYVRYLATSAVQNLTSVQHLDFSAQIDPSSIGAGVASVVLSQDASRVAYVCQNHENAATLGRLTINIPTTNTGLYWELDAERNVYVPYIGDFSFKLSDMGIVVPSTVGLRIAYDPFENAYVTLLAPQLSGNYTDILPTMKITKVAASVPFRADNAFTNLGLMRMQMATTAAGAIVGVAMGNPMGLLALPQSVSQYTQAKLSEATGYRMTGQPGGDPAFTGQVDASVITVTVVAAIPRDGYTAMWTVLGMPDGAWRNLSTLSGYAEVEEIVLNNINASESERNEITRLLAGGVYF